MGNLQNSMSITFGYMYCVFFGMPLFHFSTMMKGADSHKSIDVNDNFILRQYYTNEVNANNYIIRSEAGFTQISCWQDQAVASEPPHFKYNEIIQ